MKMTISETINAPVGEVFEVFSDFRSAAARVEGIEDVEILTEGPIGRGTRFRETRIMFGRESTEEMEVTRFEANKMYTVEADSCGAHFQTDFHFRPQANSTQLEMKLRTSANSLFAKLMSPLGFLMAGTMKKCMLADIAQLKQHCEQSTCQR